MTTASGRSSASGRPTATAAPRRLGPGAGKLSREAIVAAGIAAADRDGLDALSMRRLAADLGVDPMSLYNHVRDKSALVEGMADAVVAEMRAATPPAVSPLGAAHPPATESTSASGTSPGHPDTDWRDEMRALIGSARATALRHRWLPRALEDAPDAGPAMVAHIDAVLGVLRRGGASLDLAHHALHVLGSRVAGFSQDLFDDDDPGDSAATAKKAETWRAVLPYVAELALAADHEGGMGGCDSDAEFWFAIDLILDGIEHARIREAAAHATIPVGSRGSSEGNLEGSSRRI